MNIKDQDVFATKKGHGLAKKIRGHVGWYQNGKANRTIVFCVELNVGYVWLSESDRNDFVSKTKALRRAIFMQNGGVVGKKRRAMNKEPYGVSRTSKFTDEKIYVPLCSPCPDGN